MILFEQLLDALGKEAKEAPGWFFLIIACNLLPLGLLLPKLDRILESLGIDVHLEHNAIATLIAISLFFMGDCIDTILYPRDDGGKKPEKLLHSILLPLAAWAAFMIFQRNWFAVVLWFLWLVAFPAYTTFCKQGTDSNNQSGFKLLIQPPGLRCRLSEAKVSAKRKLHLQSGFYAVSKALAREAGIYTGWIMVWNESAKFVRSAFIPLLVWTIWLLWYRRWPWVLFTGLGAIAALLIYSSLKALHMCLLYERAPALDRYHAEEVREGVRVFFWNTGEVDKPKYKLIGGGVPAANLVFASGFLAPQRLGAVDYFRGLRAQYPEALFPSVPVDGRIRDRAPVLAGQIQQRFPTGDIHIIAHSMGGLDFRFLLSNNLLGLADRIVSLSTVSTPHRGSPVADAVLGLLPGIDARPVRELLDRFSSVGSGALDDLTTTAAIKFNEENPDLPHVRYLSYFGCGHISFALLPTFELIKSCGATEEEKTNDGVVSLHSARWPADLVEPAWAADHLAQIGHNLDSLDLLSSFDHKKAFARVVERATNPAAAAIGA